MENEKVSEYPMICNLVILAGSVVSVPRIMESTCGRSNRKNNAVFLAIAPTDTPKYYNGIGVICFRKSVLQRVMDGDLKMGSRVFCKGRLLRSNKIIKANVSYSVTVLVDDIVIYPEKEPEVQETFLLEI